MLSFFSSGDERQINVHLLIKIGEVHRPMLNETINAKDKNETRNEKDGKTTSARLSSQSQALEIQAMDTQVFGEDVASSSEKRNPKSVAIDPGIMALQAPDAMRATRINIF